MLLPYFLCFFKHFFSYVSQASCNDVFDLFYKFTVLVAGKARTGRGLVEIEKDTRTIKYADGLMVYLGCFNKK